MSGRGVRTAANWAAIRRALLDLCFERGFSEFALPTLLERAGVDEASFDYHFADLEDCLCGVLDAIRKDLLARVERATSAQECWRERIRATGYVLLEFLREDERVTHLCVIETRRVGGRPQRLLDETIARLTDLLDEGRAELDDPESSSRATAEQIAARIFELICVAVEGDHLDEGEDMIRLLIYEAVRPYLGVDVAARELNAVVDPDTLGSAR